MKALFKILVLFILIVLTIAFFAPKDFRIEREIIINKPKTEVFSYLKMVRNSNEWSPWAKKDPKMLQKFKGQDGTVGFVSSWAGNREVGVGEEEIKSIIEGERIDFELRFSEPMKATNKAYLITEAVDVNHTKVVWGMTGRTEFPLNIICFFMQKKVGEEFTNGLNSLRMILEK